jgi:RNA polymerase sigma factor
VKDERIIKDLFNRSEEALKVLKEKYEKPCMNIAMKLVSREDAEECVNDTFLAV